MGVNHAHLIALLRLGFFFTITVNNYFLDSSQDGDGGATNNASNQEAVFSQIKKFQVGAIRICGNYISCILYE